MLFARLPIRADSDPPFRGGGGDTNSPSAAERPLDPEMARKFLKITLLLQREQERWKTLKFQDTSTEPPSRYLVAQRDNVIVVPTPGLFFREGFSRSIEALALTERIGEVVLYDTMISSEVMDLLAALAEQIPALKLRIRDHHGEAPRVQHRLNTLRKIFGDRADIVVKNRDQARTCFELVGEHCGELAMDDTKRLLLFGPPDFDAIQCVALGFGLTYPGQENDVQAIEARNKQAQQTGVSPLGDDILDALRVLPIVVDQQGHKTFATMHLMASMQAMTIAADPQLAADAWKESLPGQTLQFLGDIHRQLTHDLICELLKSHMGHNVEISHGRRVNIAVLDLTGGTANSRLRLAPEALQRTTELHSTRLRISVRIPFRQVLEALLDEPERLRMGSVQASAQALAQQGEIPRDSLIFIRYPTVDGERVKTRFIARGSYQYDATLWPPTSTVGSTYGVLSSERDFTEWLRPDNRS